LFDLHILVKSPNVQKAEVAKSEKSANSILQAITVMNL